MAYKYETQYDSPNYTPGGEASATWGRPRTIEAIAIHWWGDPNSGPTYEGVIATLLKPGGVSAHFVATGTGRRVAQLVNLGDASWATNSANPYTISIECDPRCRPEDYDVVGELIAELRAEYGNLPLVPHKQFVATACPGNYDLNRLNQVAATKRADKTKDFGQVESTGVLQGMAIIDSSMKTQIRIISSEVKGWDFAKVHSGQYDEQEFKFWNGKPVVDFLQGAWDEGAWYRTLKDQWKAAYERLPVVVKELEHAIVQRNEANDNLAKALRENDKLREELASRPTESPSEGPKPTNPSDETSSAFGRFLEALRRFWRGE